MAIWQFQSNFNKGELDPTLVGRIDLQAYYNGLREATNVLTSPQGGVKRRPGQLFLGEARNDGRIENFSFNTEQQYLLVFVDGTMQVYKDGALQTNLNGTGNDFIFADIYRNDFDFIQSADTAIITQEDFIPQILTRTSDTEWVINDAVFTNIPQYDFNDALSPTPLPETQTITFANQNEGDRYKLALEGLLTEEIVFAGDDATNHSNIRIALQDLVTLPGSGVSVSGTSPSYTVVFGGESAAPYDLLTGTGIYTENIAFSVSTVRDTTGVSSAEDVWSNTRGWPRTCTFHESRLYFGGSISRPATIWGSNVNDFFNFDSGRGRDDEAIDVTLDTDQVNSVRALFSNRSLQVFTSGAEFYVKESPVTPSNVSVSPQTNLGSKRIRPVSIDGVTLFVQRTGKTINQFVFINEFQSNATTSVSSLAPHLIKDPIKITARRGTQSSDANYVYILNNDGTLTVFNTLTAESVQAFTSWNSGEITSVAVVDDELYMLVKRGNDYYVEKEDLTLTTDSAVVGSGGNPSTITGLDHLEGFTVDVKADGAYQGQFVVSGGKVELTRDIDDTWEVGIPFTPVIRTMPLNVGLQNGPNAASKKKILRAAVRLFESNGVIINGQRLADKTISINQFDAPEPQTGLKRITLLGWSLEADITITQDTPMPMNILSLGMEVKD